jgi:quercetin dioxygenase-like cupin family protein
MLAKNNNKIKSQYFDFKKELKFNLNKISEYRGWNGLFIIKFDILKGENLHNSFINSNYQILLNKEKIFVVTKGKIELKLNGSSFFLKEFDAVDFITELDEYEIKCTQDATMYMISSKDLESYKGKPIFFNFKKNTIIKDLWGGNCISRPYEGKGLTLVLFDLKPGFKFEDKGHANEQITWLIKGEMNFHADGNHKLLSCNDGVDIGPNHVHGGISNGAIGFDAFFPKRQELKYRKDLKK